MSECILHECGCTAPHPACQPPSPCHAPLADAIASLHALLLAAPRPLAASSPQLAALLVSLAGSCRVAEELSRCGRLEQLLALAAGPAEPLPVAAAAAAGEAAPGSLPPAPVAGGPGAGDELLWRLLRAMAEHESEPLRARFAPALERIARLVAVRREGEKGAWRGDRSAALCRCMAAPLLCHCPPASSCCCCFCRAAACPPRRSSRPSAAWPTWTSPGTTTPDCSVPPSCRPSWPA